MIVSIYSSIQCCFIIRSLYLQLEMAGSSLDVDLLMEECDDMPDLVDMLPDGGKLPSLIDQNTEGLTAKDPEEFVSVSLFRCFIGGME